MTDPMVARVAKRFQDIRQETKKTRMNRIVKRLREETGISREKAEDIADAVLRNRDLDTLARQKSWPMYEGTVEGPRGSIPVMELRIASDEVLALIRRRQRGKDKFERLTYYRTHRLEENRRSRKYYRMNRRHVELQREKAERLPAMHRTMPPGEFSR